MTQTFETNRAEETFAFGKRMAELAAPGEVYCLYGDLGVGKTVFAQGFGAGLGITEPLASPTFTILKEYDEGRLPLFHFDCYRIASSDEMEEIGYFDKVDGDGVCLIEWPSMIDDILPESRIKLEIKKNTELGYDYRQITVEGKNISLENL